MTIQISYTPEEEDRIRVRQRMVNKGALYATGAAVLAMVIPGIYRNLGDISNDALTTSYGIQMGGYLLLLAGGVAALFNNIQQVGDPATPDKKSLESKLSE